MRKEQEQEPEIPYQLKKTKLSTYQAQFDKLKKEMLHYKWTLDVNLDHKGSLGVRKRMEKISKLLFEIEAEFRKYRGK